jgi:uncharacterized protein (DUF1501 family)
MNIHKLSTIRPSRRAIMKAAVGCGAMGSLSMASTFLNLHATRAMADESNPNDYKSLVCVFLNGGNDSFNMLVPKGGEYPDYSTARGGETNGGIAIASNQLRDIVGPNGRAFGLHPNMNSDLTGANSVSSGAGIQGLYNNNKLSFIANVGSLIEPTSYSSFQTQRNLPLGLFSHADLQRHWMTGVPQDRSQLKGWGGRMADLVRDCNTASAISMNISLSGSNIFQTGVDVAPYGIATNGATPIDNYYSDLSATTNSRYRAFSQIQTGLLNSTYENLMCQTLAESHKIALDAAIEFNTLTNVVSVATPFDTDGLSQRLKRVAQVIGARAALGQRRQVFFVEIGGFDNHANLITDHGNNMQILSRGLSSFYEAMRELDVENDVVTFTASDFSRTLSSNGQGSDHAWGGNHLIMGGPIDGGKIFGDFPTSLVNPVDSNGETINLGRGRLIPTTSVDQYASEIATWFGVPSSRLSDILPNLENFSSEPALNMFV